MFLSFYFRPRPQRKRMFVKAQAKTPNKLARLREREKNARYILLCSSFSYIHFLLRKSPHVHIVRQKFKVIFSPLLIKVSVVSIPL